MEHKMDDRVIKPPKLKHGDTIGVISPGSPVNREQFQRGVQYLEEQGYKVLLGRHVYDQRGYLAGEDRDRAEDVNAMFQNPEVKAIFCARGGYGLPRILDLIDYNIIRKNPKILVGYSDITALQLAIFSQTGLITFSGPMVAIEMGKGMHHYTEEHFWKALTSPGEIGALTNPEDLKFTIYREGTATGRLIGGCLSVITALTGTKYMPDFTDAFLFLEDVGEEPYRLDRYLMQLKLAGVLNSINGLIFGQFIDCVPSDETRPTLQIEDIIHEVITDLDIPVIAGLAYGHDAVKLTLPIGARVHLDTNAQSLEIIEEWV